MAVKLMLAGFLLASARASYNRNRSHRRFSSSSPRRPLSTYASVPSMPTGAWNGIERHFHASSSNAIEGCGVEKSMPEGAELVINSYIARY